MHFSLLPTSLVLAMALTFAACSTANTPDVAAPAAGPTAVGDISATYEAFGNPEAEIVLIFAQGGPDLSLETSWLEGTLATLIGADMESAYVVMAHQAQTIDNAPYESSDISFEQAKKAGRRSRQLLADIVEHFKAEGRRVYLVGISFGAFLVQDLLAEQGNVAEGYLLMVGRLEMPEAVWSEFAQGRTIGFVDGTEVEQPPPERASVAGGPEALDRNMARLAAGLGHIRYTETLDAADLSNAVYVYGQQDESVGQLTASEVEFLKQRGSQVIPHPGGHEETIDANLGPQIKQILDGTP